MEFCPKCGSILVQKTKRFSCPKCNYVTDNKIKLTSTEKIAAKQKVNVLREEQTNVWPTVKETCPTCGHDEAEFWSVQTRSGDEAETRFFRCKKCKHTWRDYS